MIARIESNCTTGEVKYFDENEVEISQEIALSEIQLKENVEVIDAPTISSEIPN